MNIKKSFKKLVVFFITFVLVISPIQVSFNSISVFSVQAKEQKSVDYKVDLKHIYTNEKNYQKDYNYLMNFLIPILPEFKGKLNTVENMKEFMLLQDQASALTLKIFWYGKLSYDLDITNEKSNELYNNGNIAITSLSSALSFYITELTKKSDKELRELFMYDPDNKKRMDRIIEDFKELRNHTLSEDAERILALGFAMRQMPQSIRDNIMTADPIFPVYKDENNTYLNIEEYNFTSSEKNKDENMAEYKKIAKEVYEQNDNALAAALMAEVTTNNFFAKAKNYNSVLESSLSSASISKDVYENLLKSVNDNLEPLHKYYDLSKKFYSNLALNKTFKIDDAQKIIPAALQPLGKDYADKFQYALNNNWIDLKPSQHKTQTNYTTTISGVHPYILMNYYDNYFSLSTLIHEFGHAMNFDKSMKANGGSSWMPPSYISEIPSTLNELLLNDYLKKNAKSEEEKLFYIKSEIDNIATYFFMQTMFAEFEKNIYDYVDKGGILTADYLNNLYGQLLIKYYGEGIKEDLVDGTSNDWIYVPHFYMDFYVYKYATSLALTYDIGNRIIDGEEGLLEKYNKFLTIGDDYYPDEALKVVGIDMKNDKSIENMIQYFQELLDEYEKLYEKISE